ncbi:Serine recombinase PinR [Methylobacterium tardum]|uniref:Resolvase n=1 Tax=Methylobacterium tardum TaxID=374432 RepID=A0AA37TIM1_9HYPH|nr:recombinase family protein [Methylobacterium tardum]URD38739.1 recombinase family protein [Methylobacterium tardum]URD38777.1 recombinase family protein [Methylobacterium tardum]GJE53474.1 Serine recombinase PinR [Methylobacterium tardum]GLS74616.1 resolvase [Methylobacterium tardum]
MAVGLAEARIRENLGAMKVALYARVSTSKGQTVENQLRELQAVGARLGWTVVAIHIDEGISGARGRDRRPGYDALLKGVARREYDLIAAWSVDRLGRSLQDLVGFLAEVQSRGVGLYLHVQGLDTTTPSGRLLFSLLSVFADYERSMVRDRVLAGLERTRSKGTRLGRPPLDAEKAEAIRALLAAGVGIRETARRTGVGASTVQRVHVAMTASQDEETITAAA